MVYYKLAMNKRNKNQASPVINSVLLFFLSYCLGVLLHCMIHELGHVFAIWMQGGTMTGFYFHPFNSCLNSSTYVPNHILLYAGGAFLGLPFTIVFMIIALKYRSPVMFPFIVTGSFGFLHTGIWMIKAIASPETATDYTYMIELGTPGLIIFIAGVLYILFGVFSRIYFLPLAGIDHKVKLRTRIAIYLLGIIPWYILHGLYNIAFNNSTLIILAIIILPELVYALTEAGISLPLQRKTKFFRKIESKSIKNRHFIIIIIAALLLYLIAAVTNALFYFKP